MIIGLILIVSAPSLAQITPKSLDSKCCHAQNNNQNSLHCGSSILHSSLKLYKFQYIVQIKYIHLTSLLTNNFWGKLGNTKKQLGLNVAILLRLELSLAISYKSSTVAQLLAKRRQNTWRTQKQYGLTRKQLSYKDQDK